MTDADRLYRERARREAENRKRSDAAASQQHLNEIRGLITEIRQRMEIVLELLKAANYELGELVTVSLIRRGMFGRLTWKEEQVASWLLHTMTRRVQDGDVEFDCWLTSRGSIAIGARHWGVSEFELVDDDEYVSEWLPGIRDGLEAWEQRLSTV